MMNRIWNMVLGLARPLAVWLSFFLVLGLSKGALAGVPALLVATLVALVLWHRRTRQICKDGWRGLSTRARSMRVLPLVLTLLPLGVLMMPEASTRLQPLPDDPGVQYWPTSDGRSVAVYRFAPSPSVPDRHQALVFVHGGPGAYIRNFDRDFLAGFARDGFEVVLYDQFGSGRSPLGDAASYNHEGNVADLLAVLDRVAKPAVLLGQSYGAAVITSALQSPRAHNWVRQVVLTEPGKLPGGISELDPTQTDKTTIAPDASEAPSLSVLSSMLAPRMLAATFLPAGNHFVPQEELINLATPAVQRSLIASGYCRGGAAQLDQFEALRFNPAANVAVSQSALKAQRPKWMALNLPVMLLLGECSYVPRGRAMAYFDVLPIARSQWLPGVGHILWGTPAGQAMTRDAVLRFVDGKPAAMADEPTAASRGRFVKAGR